MLQTGPVAPYAPVTVSATTSATKQLRHRASYAAAPPTNSCASCATRRCERHASAPHCAHTAWSLVTYSAMAMSAGTGPNGRPKPRTRSLQPGVRTVAWMRVRLWPCASCRRHVRDSDTSCPFCGGRAFTRRSEGEPARFAWRLPSTRYAWIVAGAGMAACSRAVEVYGAPPHEHATVDASATTDAATGTRAPGAVRSARPPSSSRPACDCSPGDPLCTCVP